jgi:hypothetical protein
MSFSYYWLSHSPLSIYRLLNNAAGKKDALQSSFEVLNQLRDSNSRIPTLCVLEANYNSSGKNFVFRSWLNNISPSWMFVFYSGEDGFMEEEQSKYNHLPNVKFFKKGDANMVKCIKIFAAHLTKMGDKSESVPCILSSHSVYNASPHRFEAAVAANNQKN